MKSVPVTRPEIILKEYPLSESLESQVERDTQELKDIIEGTVDKKILIVGPCSAWPKQAVVDFYKQLQPIAKEVSDKIKVVARVYTQKPRTAIGWTGPMNQPDPGRPADIDEGIRYCREMMIEVLGLGFSIADEGLFTHNEGYFHDVLSYIAVGARSAEDQEHRVHASLWQVPVGLKNPTSGNLQVGANSVLAAQHSHTFLNNGNQLTTDGNKDAHLILRGGNGVANYDQASIYEAIELLKSTKANGYTISNPSIIIDCSHENSLVDGKKDPMQQPQIMLSVAEMMRENPELYPYIKGFMMESFIKEGKQSYTNGGTDLTGLSITDGCLGIEKTNQAIRDLYSVLKKS